MVEVLKENENTITFLLVDDASKRAELTVWKNASQMEFLVTEKREKRDRFFSLALEGEQLASLQKILKERIGVNQDAH